MLYNWTLAERFRLQYASRTFQFSESGGIRDGVETIPWDPSYLSKQGLDTLIDRGIAPNPEVFLHRQRDRAADVQSVVPWPAAPFRPHRDLRDL